MFFKKKKESVFVSFMEGSVINLDHVKDQVFSSRMMGDGYAIEPTGERVVAPCDGDVTVVFPTKHAYGITTNDGKEVLLHLGVDTVELNGEGFEAHVKVGDHVKAGDLLATMNLEFIRQQGKPVTSMLIFTSGEKIELLKENQTVDTNVEGIFNFIN